MDTQRFPEVDIPRRTRGQMDERLATRGIRIEPRPLSEGQPYHEGELLVLRDALGTVLGLRRVTVCREATAADECGRKVEWLIKTEPVFLNA